LGALGWAITKLPFLHDDSAEPGGGGPLAVVLKKYSKITARQPLLCFTLIYNNLQD